MNGGTGKIGLWRDRGVAQSEAEADVEVARVEDAPIFSDHHYEEGPPDFDGRRPWPAIAAAGLLSAGWLGLFGWGAWTSLDGAAPAPAQIAQWIATASAPLALIGVLYVLLQRNSRAEARRFGRTAAALRAESAALEAALAIAAAKLEDNRASLAEHIADLVARGDDAARSLAGINTAIGAEGEAISRHATTLKTSATAARADMEVLLASLPKAHAQTQEMVVSLQEAGLGVHERAGALEAQLSTVVARGREADDVVGGAAQRLGAHLARIGDTSEAAGDRLEGAARQMTGAVDTALAKAAEAVDAARRGMDAQAEAMRAMVEQSRAAIERTGHESVAALDIRLNEMSARVSALDSAMRDMIDYGRKAIERTGTESAEALEGRLGSMSERVEAFSASMRAMIDRNRSAIERTGDETAEILGNRLGEMNAQVETLSASMHDMVRMTGVTIERAGQDTADALRLRLDEMSARVDALGAAMFAMIDRNDTAIERSGQHTTDRLDAMLDGMAARIDSMGVTIQSMVDRSNAAIERTGQDTSRLLGGRLEGMAARVAALGDALSYQDATSREMLERLGRELTEIEARFETLDNDGSDRAERLSGAMTALQEEAERARIALETGGITADGFTAKVEALLVSLDASAREIDETLPAAFNRLSGHARQAKATIGAIAPDLERLEAATHTVLAQLGEAETLLAGQHATIGALVNANETSLADARAHVAELGAAIDATDAQARGFAERAGPLLVEALLRVRETANQAAEKARMALANVIPEASERLGQEAGESMRRALVDRVQGQMDEVAAGAERAVDAAQKASDRLAQQMASIAESSAVLEARITEARAEADAANNDSFARRVSLLIESLNSTAIDVSKILSNDVTDSAWAAYLKGDRGVFARRAVRLLDSGEAREIARHYDSDADFRERVNRYIHDFEAMLRTVLATRDGSPLGVTLLSSDNGKLYVALAQGIERLR